MRLLANHKDGKIFAMVATQAYRLGVDFPCVVRVIHYGIPSDLIGYIQDAGRCNQRQLLRNAGSIVVYNKQYCENFLRLVSKNKSGEAQATKLLQMMNYCEDEKIC